MIRLLILLVALLAIPTISYAKYSYIISLHYFNIIDDDDTSYGLSISNFKDNMEYLQHDNIIVVPLDEAITHIKNGGSYDKMPVAISFEHGYKSLYDKAFPLLKHYNYPFTFFISTININSNIPKYINALHIKNMLRHNGTIGSHGISFNNLVTADHITIWNELHESKQILEERFKQPITLFSYNYGNTSDDIMAMAEQAGYIAAFGQQSGIINTTYNPYFYPRFVVTNKYYEHIKKRIHYKPLEATIIMPSNPTITSNDYAYIRLSIKNKYLQNNPNALNCYPDFSKNFFIEYKEQRDDHLIYDIHFTDDNIFTKKRNRLNCVLYDGDNYFWFGTQWNYYN